MLVLHRQQPRVPRSVSKETLRYLYSTKAITGKTYVFAENLAAEGPRQWTRVHKLPELHEELQRGSRAEPPAGQPPQESSSAPAAASASSSSKPFELSLAPAPAPAHVDAPLDVAPRATAAPQMATPRAQVNMMPAGFQAVRRRAARAQNPLPSSPLPPPARAPRAHLARSPLLLQAADGERLSAHLTGRPATSARSSSGGGGGGGFMSIFRKKPKPPTHPFGAALDGVRVAEGGVPAVLAAMRGRLWEHQGYLIEGIFRVTAAASTFKKQRELAEGGKWDKLDDMESVAQLIKVWFREVPGSIFGLEQARRIADGELSDGAACYALVEGLPDLNRRTILWLLELIYDVCRHEDQNSMTPQAMTIVFAPNLVSPPDSMDPMLCLQLNKRVVQFAEKLFDFWNGSGGPSFATWAA